MSLTFTEPTPSTITRSPENREILTPPNDLVFILIKPLGIENREINYRIMETLAKYGRIENAKSRIFTDRELIENHYKSSEGQPYHPPLVSYLTEQRATYFVLRDTRPWGVREEGFAQYLRSSVIGPSNPEKTQTHHIRNLTKQYDLDYKIEVNVPEEEKIDGYSIAFDNLVHCSDSTESALSEIATWYSNEPEVVQYYSDEFEPILREMEPTHAQ